MSVETILEEVEGLVASFEKQREELVAKLKPSFGEIFKPFLAAHPEVTKLQFHAYTPYFNDGEPCEFSVGELNGFLVTDEEDYEGSLPSYNRHAAVYDYRKFGKVDEHFKRLYNYLLSERETTIFKNGKYEKVTVPAGYASLEEAVEGDNEDLMAMDLSELEMLAKLDEDFDALSTLFSRIPDDIFLQLFGDHKTIVITRDGIEVEECDHD